MNGKRKIIFSGSGVNRKTGERIKFRISSKFTDRALARMDRNVDIPEREIQIGEGEGSQSLDGDQVSFKSVVLQALNEELVKGRGMRYYSDEEIDRLLRAAITPEHVAEKLKEPLTYREPMSVRYFMAELMGEVASQDTVDSLKRLQDEHPTSFEAVRLLDLNDYSSEDMLQTLIAIVTDLSVLVNANDRDFRKVSRLVEAYTSP